MGQCKGLDDASAIANDDPHFAFADPKIQAFSLQKEKWSELQYSLYVRISLCYVTQPLYPFASRLITSYRPDYLENHG